MKTRRLLATLLVSLLAGCGREETPAAVPAEPMNRAEAEARAVLARFVEVTRWKDKLAQASSRHDVGRVKFSGIEGKAETWIRKPDRQVFALDITGFGKMQSGYDGRTAWMSGQMTGSHLLTGTDLLQTRLDVAWEGVLKPAALYESMRVVGPKVFEGKECLELEFVARPLEGMDPAATREARTTLEYYEVASGLLIGATGWQESELASGPFTRLFLDYQELGGVLVPTVARIKQGGIEMELIVETVEFDTVTDEALQPPLEIRKLIEVAGTPAPAPAAGGAPR